jgi:DNA-binding NtrC family response regulator
MKTTILIVDDKEKLCKSLAWNFEHVGHKALYATNGNQALEVFRGNRIDVVLLDVMLADESGIDILKRLLAANAKVPVVMITAYASIDTAVQSIKLGAFDYVKKPLDFDELLKTVENAYECSRLRQENVLLRNRLKEDAALVVTQDPHMLDLCRKAERLSATDLPVLICGESGTGKEVIADTIHASSARGGRKMIKINCVAYPESLLDNELFGHEKGAYTGADSAFKGVFEKANGSSLFLDEIGDMSLGIQAKILRTLQNSEVRRLGGSETIRVDVRFIAATNKDLGKLIEKNLFREDLYYRLNTAVLTVPPLRERKEDIPLLVNHFLDEHLRSNPEMRKEVTPTVLARFLEYSWPGNVRELKNILNYAIAMSSTNQINAEDLPVSFPDDGLSSPTGNIREDMERQLILSMLQSTNHNRSKAAVLLRMSRKTLYNKMERYGINA